MSVRKIIREEIAKLIQENYPMGSEYISDAPWNQSEENVRPGEKADKIKYKVVWFETNAGIALLKDVSNNLFVFTTDSFVDEEYKDYADIPMEFSGTDEDGMPDFDYGDWEMNSSVVENFVNDNLDKISIGTGFNDYDSGNFQLIAIDSELRDDLMNLSKYLSSGKDEFLSILGEINEEIKIVNQETMDTPTGTIFHMNIQENELKKNNKRRG